MKPIKHSLIVVVGLVLAAALIPGEAFAGPRRGASSGMRSSRSSSIRSSPSRSSGIRRSPQLSRSGTRSTSSSGFSRGSRSVRNTGGSSSFSRGDRAGNGRSSTSPFSGRSGQNLNGLQDLMGLFGGYGGPGNYGGYDRYHDPHKEYADAYRDAAIVNAVAGLLGVIVQASVANNNCAQQTVQPVATQAVVQQPVGVYTQTQRRMVQEEHYVKEEVWVPERYDEANQVWIEGHTQVIRRWVPPVWQEQQVYVDQR